MGWGNCVDVHRSIIKTRELRKLPRTRQIFIDLSMEFGHPTSLPQMLYDNLILVLR